MKFVSQSIRQCRPLLKYKSCSLGKKYRSVWGSHLCTQRIFERTRACDSIWRHSYTRDWRKMASFDEWSVFKLMIVKIELTMWTYSWNVLTHAIWIQRAWSWHCASVRSSWPVPRDNWGFSSASLFSMASILLVLGSKFYSDCYPELSERSCLRHIES